MNSTYERQIFPTSWCRFIYKCLEAEWRRSLLQFDPFVSLLPHADNKIWDGTRMRNAFTFKLHKQLESMRIVVLVVLITLHYSVNNFAGTILDAVPSVAVDWLLWQADFVVVDTWRFKLCRVPCMFNLSDYSNQRAINFNEFETAFVIHKLWYNWGMYTHLSCYYSSWVCRCLAQ